LVLVGNAINPTHRIKDARMAEKLGVASRVTITSCAFEELPDFLAAADIAVVPRSESAGIPTKLLNYMAAGKAIVSFEKSATILENGKTGRLVAPVTAEALAEGIISLLVDRNLALELGRNAKSLILGRLDWPTIVEQIERVYDKVLAERVIKGRRPLASNNQPRGRVRAKRAFLM
jgi:1,2-diacylglycerol 3-alpha-glucosyltransferase